MYSFRDYEEVTLESYLFKLKKWFRQTNRLKGRVEISKNNNRLRDRRESGIGNRLPLPKAPPLLHMPTETTQPRPAASPRFSRSQKLPRCFSCWLKLTTASIWCQHIVFHFNFLTTVKQLWCDNYFYKTNCLQKCSLFMSLSYVDLKRTFKVAIHTSKAKKKRVLSKILLTFFISLLLLKL